VSVAQVCNAILLVSSWNWRAYYSVARRQRSTCIGYNSTHLNFLPVFSSRSCYITFSFCLLTNILVNVLRATLPKQNVSFEHGKYLSREILPGTDGRTISVKYFHVPKLYLIGANLHEKIGNKQRRCTWLATYLHDFKIYVFALFKILHFETSITIVSVLFICQLRLFHTLVLSLGNESVARRIIY